MKKLSGLWQSSVCIVALLSSVSMAGQGPVGPGGGGQTIHLNGPWQIQSSCKVAEKGEQISVVSFQPSGWYAAAVPGAVVANLVRDKEANYPDPYTGMNLRQMPGVNYKIGSEFANQAIPESSPFHCSWWYRTTFHTPQEGKTDVRWLNFQGINYRANIWLNGTQVADTKQIAGAWRTYELNVTGKLRSNNAIAVEVFPPSETDLGITFVDWNPMPPDKNMGLWREVYLASSGPVALRHPFVDTKVDTDTLDAAELTVYADVKNGSDRPVKGTLEVEIEQIHLAQPVELAAGETKEISFTADRYPQLHVKKPRLWWPAKLGPQNLYQATFSFKVQGQDGDSDRQAIHFGIRQVTSEFTDKGYRLFKINGKKIVIRGGGWTFDMLLDRSDRRVEQEMRYALDMNLNTIRLEGKIESDHFFDLADRTGMLVMAGWCCCDFWEKWGKWSTEDKNIAAESLRSQLLRIRYHPSTVMWLNGSDNPPNAEVEQRYLAVEKEIHWPTPVVSSATQKKAEFSGASGVKMTGPYEYVPPSYWLADTKNGGAYGFNTETSPGAAIPTPQSLRKFIPADHLWPIDDYWNFHAGGGQFKDLKRYTDALDRRYGPSASMEEYSLKSQAAAYEGERAMFEAYVRNKYTSTGVIQWMLNNAWPSLIWHLYDWYLTPGGGYFGAKKANELLHVQYSEDDSGVYVTNSRYEPSPNMKVRVQVLNLDMAVKFEKEASLDVAADSSVRVLTVPDIAGLSPTYFVRVWLMDASGKTVSDNFYWRSLKPDVMDWGHSQWFYTPATQLEDLSALKSLPKVTVNASATAHAQEDQTVMRITVKNPSKSLGFQVHLRVTNGSDEDILPILFDDNYFPLFPGEERTISAKYDAKQLSGAPTVVVEGWNVQPLKVQAKLEGGNAPTRARITERPVKPGANLSPSGTQ
jgi:exo-1,4-beta-D-glucosaminidase